MDNKKLLKITSVCILVLVPLLQIFSRYLEKYNIISAYGSINPAIVLYFSILVLLFIYIKDLIKKRRKLDIYDYLFYILIFTGILSTIFSIDKGIAILGREYREEGLLSVISYYLLFINWKVNGQKDIIEKFIKFITIIAILNSIYALFQIYTDFDFIIRYTQDENMAFGLCINPNFFGSLIVTVLSINICKYLISKKSSLLEYLIIILLFISLINSQSTGPFLTLILVIIFLTVFLKIKKSLIFKRLLILCLLLIATYTSTYFVNKYIYTIDRCEMCDIDKTINDGGNGRIEIWKNSLKLVKNHPLVGVGYDNFFLVYPNSKIDNTIGIGVTTGELEIDKPNTIYIIDNAHNIYLHTLVTTGILGLIPYLLLCLFTFIRGLKSNNKLMFILLSGFVAYSIQGFANISVIEVAPIYFIIIGLMLSIKD